MVITRVIGYTRVSSFDQVSGKGASVKSSLENQEQLIRDYCEKKGWDLVEVFTDPGISGETIDARHELQRAMRLVERGGVTALVLYNGDRLSRNMADYFGLVQHFEWTNRVAIVDLSAPIDFDPLNFNPKADEGRLFNHTFKAVLAQSDQQQRTRRLSAGRAKQVQSGRYIAPNIPFGYKRAFIEVKNERGEITGMESLPVPDEETYPYLLGLPSLIINRGLGLQQVVRIFSEKRVGGKELWYVHALRYIIRSPFYAGYVVKNRFDRANIEKPISEWETYPHSYEHPWTLETREEMITALESRNVNLHPRTAGSKNPLAGLLRCGYCGNSLSIKTIIHKNKRVPNRVSHRYVCAHPSGTCRSSYYVPELVFEKVAMHLDMIYEERNYQTEPPDASAQDEIVARISKYELELKTLLKRKGRIDLAFQNEVFDVTEYRSQLEALSEEREAIEKLLEGAKLELEKVGEVSKATLKSRMLLDRWLEVRDAMLRPIDQWTKEQAQEFRTYLQQIFKTITITGKYDKSSKVWQIDLVAIVV